MKIDNFDPDDAVAYLNQELPGFEPSLIRDSPDTITLRVRTNVQFAAYHTAAREVLCPVPQSWGSRPYGLQRWVDELIHKTRRDVIEKLGLQKEIDAEVQRKLNAERQRIENEAYRKAMNDALDRVAESQEKAREKLAAGLWNTFMGRPADDVETEDDE